MILVNDMFKPNLNQILAIDITYERNKMIDNTQSDRDDN